MKCGVRFCGGCNPRFDRGSVYRTIKERRTNDQFEFAEEGIEYDYLLVIGGCTNCCTSYEQFTYKLGAVKLWDKEQLEEVVKQIEDIEEQV